MPHGNEAMVIGGAEVLHQDRVTAACTGRPGWRGISPIVTTASRGSLRLRDFDGESIKTQATGKLEKLHVPQLTRCYAHDEAASPRQGAPG